MSEVPLQLEADIYFEPGCEALIIQPAIQSGCPSKVKVDYSPRKLILLSRIGFDP